MSYAGVFGPAYRQRAKLGALMPARAAEPSGVPAPCGTNRGGRIPWTELLRRVFVLDVLGKGLSYIVLPRPHVGGAFLFELGAAIPPAAFPNEGPQQYDHLRAYCSIRMP